MGVSHALQTIAHRVGSYKDKTIHMAKTKRSTSSTTTQTTQASSGWINKVASVHTVSVSRTARNQDIDPAP
jgi:hypothetical protein